MAVSEMVALIMVFAPVVLLYGVGMLWMMNEERIRYRHKVLDAIRDRERGK